MLKVEVETWGFRDWRFPPANKIRQKKRFGSPNPFRAPQPKRSAQFYRNQNKADPFGHFIGIFFWQQVLTPLCSWNRQGILDTELTAPPPHVLPPGLYLFRSPFPISHPFFEATRRVHRVPVLSQPALHGNATS